MFMMSSGGLTSADLFAGKDAILSGPAGGVVAMARTAASAGFRRVIGFDMGGTSTDVAHFDGDFERAFETEVAGVRMRAPMMKIHTVAAGGGSILHFDGARFRVGPDSAGADPGPAAYRRGGPLAVTDANLMTGKLIPDFFPESLRTERRRAARRRGRARKIRGAGARDRRRAQRPRRSRDGFLAIAVAKMAEAIKTISVARGYDVTRYALNCFGGAGGQHACDVADALAITTVLIHPLSSLLSAYGMGLADISAATRAGGRGAARRRRPRPRRPRRRRARRRARSRRSSARASNGRRSRFIAARTCATPARTRRSKSPLRAPAAMRRAFESAHTQRFGFIDRAKALVIEAVSAEAVGGAARFAERTRPIPQSARA